jgi:deazaflavin-dependent oxidoreductase (nitroreductase family)
MMPRVSLSRVDPNVSTGRAYRLFANVFANNRPGLWLSRQVAWRLDPLLLRASGGRLRFTLIIPSAVLETRGARTGLVRRHAVIYFHDGDDVVVVASKAGAATHPAWYHNARANPEVTLGGQPFRASVVEDRSDRERLWHMADNVFAPFATYRERAATAGRTIPLLRLRPRSTGGSVS